MNSVHFYGTLPNEKTLKLEAGQFARGSTGGVKRALCHTEFMALLEGVDMVIKRQRKRYKRAA